MLLAVATRNLLRRRFRTVAIALAAGLACGLVFAASNILQSLEDTLATGVSRLGADVMVVPAGHQMEASRLLIAGEPSEFYMDDAVVQQLAQLQGVELAAPQIFVTSTELECCSTPRVLLVGFDPVADFTIGPWIRYVHNATQVDAASVIVGAHTLYATEGTYMTFFGKLFKMVSSIQPTGMGFLDDSIFMSIQDARDMVRVSGARSHRPLTLGPHQISSVLVKAAKGVDASALAERMAFTMAGIQAIPIPELTATVRRDIQASVWGIVAAAGAGWVMTMLVVGLTLSLSVNERRREIGLLRAMGATRFQVVSLLLSEALLVTLAGTVLGLLAGWFISNHYLATAVGTLGPPPFLPPTLTAVGFLALSCVAAIVGSAAIAAIAPALRSVRMDPYDAIRAGS